MLFSYAILKNDLEDIMVEKDASVNIENEKLPFAKNEVYRLMKENLDSDKQIRERVKVEMNRFLGEVLKNVCKQLNDYPYTTIEYEMFKDQYILTPTLKESMKKRKEF